MAAPLAAAPQLEHVVLDAGALISGVSLASAAKNFWTVEEVVAEVRDPLARERLKSLPFELKFKRPSEQAVVQVAEFAKKTGDFRELSRTDLMVLALTYMMEVECNGTKFLKPEPVSIPLDMLDVIDDPSDDEKATPAPISEATPSESQVEVGDGTAVPGEDADEGWTEVRHRKLDTNSGSSKTQKRRQQRKAAKAAAACEAQAAPDGVLAAADGDRDDGEGEWFGPDTAVPTKWAAELPEGRVAVGCVTTDFAMQNVLLQMGLNLLSVSGKAVKSVKQWVLKCDSCFAISTKMDKLFCSSCGNPTLCRLGVTLKANGQAQFHYKKGRRVNLKGARYPLPAPQGGRNGDLLLREDQLLTGVWKQRMQKKETLTTMFADCNIADLLAPKTTVGADVVVGYGKRNPNALKGRERRGKPKAAKK